MAAITTAAAALRTGYTSATAALVTNHTAATAALVTSYTTATAALATTGTEFVEGPTYDADTTAFLTAAGISDETISDAVDGLVLALKAAGLWEKCNAIYPFVGGTGDTHKVNLRDPDLYELTYHDNPTHDADGFHPAGYALTGIVPSAVLTNTSTHLAYYSVTDTPGGSQAEMGCFDGRRLHVICCYSGNTFYYGMSENSVSGTTVPNSTGLFVSTRTGGDLGGSGGLNSFSAYRNGSQLATSSAQMVAPFDIPIMIGGINGSYPSRSDRTCAFASIGSGLTAQNNADLYDAVQAFQTALGREV